MTVSKASTSSHYVTMLLGTWLVLGIFIDGYAHNHGVVETFFTPWHAILYSGFLACAAWISGLIYYTKRKTGQTWRNAVPSGYGLGLLGIVIFLTGGLCDMLWHIIFGIEVSIEALLSPSHLALMIGAILILSSPLRAGWRESGEAVKWRAFFPSLLSLALSVGVASFFLMYLWMFRYNLAAVHVIEWYSDNTSYMLQDRIREDTEVRGLTYILMNTLVFMYPVFMLLRRWRVPFGSLTFLFVFISSLMGVLDGFQQVQGIVLSLLAGLASDVLCWHYRRDSDRRRSVRMIAVFSPIVMWSGYFGWLAINGGIGWVPELWVGSIVQASLLSLVLSLLSFPPTGGQK